VAIVGPLSGPRAAYGKLIETTVANFQCPPGLHWQLFDDQAQPEVALKTAHEICAVDFDVVIGHFNSDCARAVRSVYREADIPLLLPASTAVGLPDGRHVFRLCPDDLKQTAAMVALIRDRYADFQMYYWSDGSSYAQRLHTLLECMLGCALLNVSSHASSAPATGHAVVYLGSHVSIMQKMASEGEQMKDRVSICCDDCWIDEFFVSARAQTYICAPHASYKELLEHALSIVQSVYLERASPMEQFFDAMGESRSGSFHIYEWSAGNFLRYA